MSDEKVIVTKSKLDSLAMSISNKSGVAIPLTIAQMKTAVDGISTGSGGSITIEEIPNATGTTLQITTNGSGGGGSGNGQTASGTFTGDNGVSVQIPCSFEPDLIRVYGDLSGDVANRGITSLAIVKDDFMIVISDTSTSGTSEYETYGVSQGMVGYNDTDTSLPHASYVNGVLTIDMVSNTSSYRFASGITYNYKLSAGGGGSSGGGTPSATQHSIYFEFSDETNTTITAYWDDSFISNAITATTPTTYGAKTVTLAQLDGVTWYEVSSGIPLNTELVDYTKVMTGYIINESGVIENTGQSWDAISDYIPIDPSMTFTFKTNKWYNVGFYNSSKNMVRIVSGSDIETSSSNDVSTGTLNASNIPSTAAYIILPGNSYNLQGSMSLIRTA